MEQMFRQPYRLRGTVGALRGLYDYYTRGKISQGAWNRLLSAHCISNGAFTENLNAIVSVLRPARRPATAAGLLGSFTPADQTHIAQAIARDGFYRFETLMPAALCDEIEHFARNAPAELDSNYENAEAPLVVYDAANPRSRIYRIPERAAAAAFGVQKLMADRAFLAIAESYLKCLPVIGGIDVWWSARYSNEPGSTAAQLFHFDFDAPPAWLKLFVYVTEVGPDNGPHVYVKGSHRADIAAARDFRSRGYVRISDEEMTTTFGADALTSITGPRGTVFLADTRGFHKGTLPTAGHRLIAQLLYCAPQFCDHGEAGALPDRIEPSLADTIADAPRVFDRFR